MRTPSYERCSTIRETERIVERRLRAPDLEAPPPPPLEPPGDGRSCLSGHFPLLDAALVAQAADSDERSALRPRRRLVCGALGILSPLN